MIIAAALCCRPARPAPRRLARDLLEAAANQTDRKCGALRPPPNRNEPLPSRENRRDRPPICQSRCSPRSSRRTARCNAFPMRGNCPTSRFAAMPGPGGSRPKVAIRGVRIPRAGAVMVLQRKAEQPRPCRLCRRGDRQPDSAGQPCQLAEQRPHSQISPRSSTSPKPMTGPSVRFWNTEGGHFGGNTYYPYGFIHQNVAIASR